AMGWQESTEAGHAPEEIFLGNVQRRQWYATAGALTARARYRIGGRAFPLRDDFGQRDAETLGQANGEIKARKIPVALDLRDSALLEGTRLRNVLLAQPVRHSKVAAHRPEGLHGRHRNTKALVTQGVRPYQPQRHGGASLSPDHAHGPYPTRGPSDHPIADRRLQCESVHLPLY